jgi:hypothetical protein
MRHNGRIARRYGAGGLLVMIGACSGGGSDWVTPAAEKGGAGAQIHITGVVRHFELEGGFYAIRGSDSVTYDPRNLPAEFQKDGLNVEADARKRDDVMGIHQMGVIVDLERIRAR